MRRTHWRTEDGDEIPEPAGTIDDSCLIASELGDDVAREGLIVMNIPVVPVQGY